MNMAFKNSGDYFAFRTDRTIHRLKWEDIIYFSCYGHQISMVTLETSYEFHDSLRNITEQFAPKDFIRIHQSYIVNRQYVKAVQGNDLQMINGDKLQISRRYKKRVLEQLSYDKLVQMTAE